MPTAKALKKTKASSEQPILVESGTEIPRDPTWDTTLTKVKMLGDKRFQAEKNRMCQLGIVDQNGKAKSKDLPADMLPSSKTSVVT
jgi:hypothetical protein